MKKYFSYLIFLVFFFVPYVSFGATVLENPYETASSTTAFAYLQYLGDLTGIEFDRVRFALDPGSPYYDVNTYIGKINCSDGTPISWLMTDNINQGNLPGLNYFTGTFASTTGSGCYSLYVFGNGDNSIDYMIQSPSGNDFTANLRYSASGHLSDFVDGGTELSYPGFVQLCNGVCEDPQTAPPYESAVISILSPVASSSQNMANGLVRLSWDFNDDFSGVGYVAVSASTSTDPFASAMVWSYSLLGEGSLLYSPVLDVATSTDVELVAELYTLASGELSLVASSSLVYTAVPYFVPPPPTIATSTDQLYSGKWPFQYYYDLRGIFESATSSSSTFPALSIWLGFGSTSTDSIEVFSTTTVSSLLGESTIQTFRQVMSYAIYVILMYSIYFRSISVFKRDN